MNQHIVIVVPGLGDKTFFLRLTGLLWRIYGLKWKMFCFEWKSGDFEEKLDNFIKYIEGHARQGNKVSLIGISAGGSAVLNTYLQRRNLIHRVVSVCGYLRKDIPGGREVFRVRVAKNPTFSQSLNRFEMQENLLTPADRINIMTVRARFGDPLIPDDSAILSGATNIRLPSIGHGLSIALALTVFSPTVVSFIKAN